MLNLDLWKLLLDLKSIASDILRYIFEPAEWIQYIAIYSKITPPIYHSIKSYIVQLPMSQVVTCDRRGVTGSHL